jgi:hypothetical protein
LADFLFRVSRLPDGFRVFLRKALAGLLPYCRKEATRPAAVSGFGIFGFGIFGFGIFGFGIFGFGIFRYSIFGFSNFA